MYIQKVRHSQAAVVVVPTSDHSALEAEAGECQNWRPVWTKKFQNSWGYKEKPGLGKKQTQKPPTIKIRNKHIVFT